VKSWEADPEVFKALLSPYLFSLYETNIHQIDSLHHTRTLTLPDFNTTTDYVTNLGNLFGNGHDRVISVTDPSLPGRQPVTALYYGHNYTLTLSGFAPLTTLSLWARIREDLIHPGLVCSSQGHTSFTYLLHTSCLPLHTSWYLTTKDVLLNVLAVSTPLPIIGYNSLRIGELASFGI